ncbi:MAG: hypothetical protein ABR907_09425 [Terracidiphilus sp.]|jgi:hypothetical protein
MKIQNANQLSGRGTGAIFFAAFGALWFFLSLYARQQLNAASVSGVVLGLALLILAATKLIRAAKHLPRVPDDAAMGRAFAWINAAQWVAIGIVAFAFARLHIDAYVLSAITAIIGLHMFPLARLFRYAPHYATGTVLVAWAAASALLLPVDTMQGTTALGTGIILWASATVTLVLAYQGARQPDGELTC